MKFLIKLKVIIIILFLASCSANDLPSTHTTQVVNTALIDASASMEAYIAFMGSAPLCSANPACNGGMFIVSAAIGAEASGLFGGGRSSNGNDKGKQNNIQLSPNYIVPSNPYEMIGVNHNAAVNYLNSSSNRQQLLMSVFNYDDQALNSVLTSIEANLTQSMKEELITKIKVNQAMSKIKSEDWENLSTESIIEKSLSRTNFSDIQKSELKYIVQRYAELVDINSDINNETNFINSEIQKRIQPDENMTDNDRAILVFLSTLKHSNFYWKTPK